MAVGGGRLWPVVYVRVLTSDRGPFSQKGVLMSPVNGPRAAGWLLSASLIAMISLATVTGRRYSSPFPPLSISLSSKVTPLSDFAGISMGFRKLTADIAWVQML